VTAYRASQIDPTTDRAAAYVLTAFEAAERDGIPVADCYQAAVEAWWRAYPDQTRKYAARQAVDVVLAAKTSLRIEDA